MRSLRYVIADVFAEQPLAGNPLCVFTDARSLDAFTMQALARETNLSETVFVLPPARGGHARLRIFTPRCELPFAGHPVLGTAFVLGGPLELGTLRLEVEAGIISVDLTREGPRVTFAWLTPPKAEPEAEPDTAAVLAALGVSRTAFAVGAYRNGPEHLCVPLDSAEAVANLRPNLSLLAEATGALVSAFHAESGRVRTRVFAPRAGVAEDPATGSAAPVVALHLHRHGRLAADDEIVIDQGRELGRPSRIHVRGVASGAAGATFQVGGSAIIVARGQFTFAAGSAASAANGAP